MEDQCVITRKTTVAAGVFAPGHLGELTQIVPFEMVDHALAATGTAQARIRVLPSRVVVYLLLAGALAGVQRSPVLAALSTLPCRQREVVVLRYYADLSEVQTAAAMGISRGAVKAHTARAKDSLRAMLR